MKRTDRVEAAYKVAECQTGTLIRILGSYNYSSLDASLPAVISPGCSAVFCHNIWKDIAERVGKKESAIMNGTKGVASKPIEPCPHKHTDSMPVLARRAWRWDSVHNKFMDDLHVVDSVNCLGDPEVMRECEYQPLIQFVWRRASDVSTRV